MLSFLSSPLEGREYGMKIAWIKIAHAVGGAREKDDSGDARTRDIIDILFADASYFPVVA